ncbi:MAG: hypothetical protein LBP32_04785 [Spirochaetaceae bacterium]|nr:hypothetical protein [Spirochaetaceae bacterium]
MSRFSWCLWIVGFFLISCASTNHLARVDDAVARGQYQEGLEQLEEKKDKAYRQRDMILYYLDAGMISHYAESYEDSSKLLQEGERAIERAFTKSVTEAIGSYILNDTTKEYAGEDYEDVYLNVFNALNYYHRGLEEDALVEIRRMNNKLRYLSVKYDTSITNLQRSALENSAEIPYDPRTARTEFSNSALARYLGMLFDRGRGLWDDARIDRDEVRLAFANQPSVYTFPVPASLDEELDIPPGKARINIISFSGLSPVKEEETLRIPIAYHWIKIALPVLHSRPSRVARTEVVFDTGETLTLELIEDIDAVARETFKQRIGVIYLKTILRAITKTAASTALDIGAREAEDSETSLILGLLSLGAQAFAEVSEKADLRVSRYFPGRAAVGGITLDPGVYSFDVSYYDYRNHLIQRRRFENIPVDAGRLNLTEVLCLK